VPAFEYQSVYRTHTPGTPYASADDVLNDEGLDGWQRRRGRCGLRKSYLRNLLFETKGATGARPTTRLI
jgi:hypothetical protein